MESDTSKLSLKKLFLAIVGLIVLFHIKDVLRVVRQILNWFSESLSFINDFPEDAQAAIAFCSILLIVVIIFKTVNK
jgi:hypothetical protein